MLKMQMELETFSQTILPGAKPFETSFMRKLNSVAGVDFSIYDLRLGYIGVGYFTLAGAYLRHFFKRRRPFITRPISLLTTTHFGRQKKDVFGHKGGFCFTTHPFRPTPTPGDDTFGMCHMRTP